MPSLHLLRSPRDNFVYDFPYDFLGIVGGYGLRRMCLHYIRSSCFIWTNSQWTDRDKSYGSYTEIARTSYDFRAFIAQSLQAFYGSRTKPEQSPCGFRAEAVWFFRTIFPPKTVSLLLNHRTVSVRGPCGDRAMLVRYVYGLRAYDF